MSHHNSIEGFKPTKITFPPKPVTSNEELDRGIPVPLDEAALLIPGQGTLVFSIPDKNYRPAEVVVEFLTEEGAVVQLLIKEDSAKFWYRAAGSSTWEGFVLENESEKEITAPDSYKAGIDPNEACRYWVSIDYLNKHLRYGKGEMRLSTTLLDYQFDIPKNLFTRKKKEKYSFIGELKSFRVSTEISLVSLWKDPVVVEPPSWVVPTSAFSMDLAADGKKTTSASLSKECQILYGNVADFELNTPDFPDFAAAIEHSLRTPGCIGYKILKEKIDNNEFNKDGAAAEPSDEPEYQEIYLRITLGYSQGESPGIPYVMEIWPVGCASPIHHHGYTNAIIKVLRGAIDVDIYRMLPTEHSGDKALGSVTFKENEVTYLMPEVNQFHKLKNDFGNTATCITIQCYSYSQDDNEHYATFDYVEKDKLGHFDPISDCDYEDFKKKVRAEWKKYLEERFWLEDKKEDA